MQHHQNNCNSIVLRSDFVSIFQTPQSLVDSGPETADVQLIVSFDFKGVCTFGQTALICCMADIC